MIHASSIRAGDLSFVPAAALSTLVVFLLFLAMQAMVNVDLGEPEPVTPFESVGIWQPPPPEPPPPEPETALEAPNLPPPALHTPMDTISFNGVDLSEPITAGEATAEIDFGGNWDFVPLSMVAPVYPRAAQDRGIEGYCVVSFTVTRSGSTSNILAEECTHALFVSPSIRAAERLKYQPKMVEGQAVEAQHSYLYRFQLSQ